MVACSNGHPDIVRRLLRAGAFPDLQNKVGRITTIMKLHSSTGKITF